jgi:phospholipid-binding lipoprotein MlaA
VKARFAIGIGLALACGALSGCASSSKDPWQRVNRPVFGFNERVDQYVLRPVARGWTFVSFEGLRDAVDRLFTNLEYPRRLVANLGQGEVGNAGSETGRFLVNSTIGLVGLFDPATRFGLDPHDEDVGQMFGRWGIGPGPFWVVPLLGPSNPRDFVGSIFDRALSPLSYLFFVTSFGFVATTTDLVNTRALADDDIERAREAALDFYVFVRNAYIQRREYQIRNEAVPDPLAELEADDDLYEVDLDDDEEGAPNAQP